MMEGTGLWGGGAACTLKTRRAWCFGRTTHDLIAGMCVSQETYWLQREMGKSFLPPCLFWFSLFKTLSWAQLRASSLTWKEHQQQTRTMAGLGHSLSAISHVDLPCSVQFAFDFEQICLHHRPWSLTLDWLMILGSTLVTVSSPHGPWRSGLGAVLWFQQQLSQPSKDQICAKERSSLWGEGRGMAAQSGCVGGQVYRKDQEREEQVENRGHHGRKRRFQKYKEEKIERR